MLRTLALVAAVSIAVPTQAQVARPMNVAGESMNPAYAKDRPVPVTVLNFRWQPRRGVPIVYMTQSRSGKPLYYLHRVLAVSGDQIAYDDASSSFSLNGQKLTFSDAASYETHTPDGQRATTRLLHEANGGNEYSVVAALPKYPLSALVHELDQPPGIYPAIRPHECSVSDTGFTCKVPSGYVFVVGDNRAQTLLGFVPEDQIAGFVNEIARQ